MLPYAKRFSRLLKERYSDVTISRSDRTVENDIITKRYEIQSNGNVIGTYAVHIDHQGNIKKVQFEGFIAGHTSAAENNNIRLLVTDSYYPWKSERTNCSLYRHDHHYSIDFVDDEKDGEFRKSGKKLKEKESADKKEEETLDIILH